jgi:hypothetical protein
MKRNFIISALAIASVAGVFPVSAQAESVNGITSSVHKLQEGQWEAVRTSGGDSSSAQTVSGVTYKHDVMYINDIPFTDFTSSSDSGSNKYYYNYIESLYAQGIPVDIKFLARVGETKPSTGSSRSYNVYTFTTPLFTSANVGYSSLASNYQVETFLVHFKVNLTSNMTCETKREYNSSTSTDTRTYYGVRLRPFEMGISGIIDEMAGLTIEQANSIVQSYVNSMEAKNSTNNSSVQSTLQSMLGDKITVNVGALGVVPATETSKGSLTGNITITDSKGQSSQVGINKVIPRLDQTALTAKNRIESSLGNLKVTNATTQDDILADLRSRVDVGCVNLGVSNFQKTPATESTQGRVTCIVSISDGSSSYQVQVNSPISRLPQSLDSIYEQASNVISKFQASNNTTEKDILDLITIKNDSVTANVVNFGVVPATESSRGHLTGKVVLSEGSYSKEIDLSGCTIDYLPQSLETVYDSFSRVLSNMKATNSTTMNDILSLVNITNSDISVRIDGFSKSDATDLTEGKITGVLNLSDKSTSKSIDLNLVIDRLAQSLDTASTRINSILASFKANNDTTESDVLRSVRSGVDTSVISVDFSTAPGKTFTKSEASELTAGKVSGVLVISDGVSSREIPVNLQIDRLIQSLSTVKNQFSAILEAYRGTNETTEDDIINSVTITNKDISCSIVDFHKVDATDLLRGKITGSVRLVEGSTVENVPFNIPIERLVQSALTASEVAKSIVDNMNCTNNTVEQDIIRAVKASVDASISVSFSKEDGKAFKLVKSSEKSTGRVTGTLLIADTKETIEVPVSIVIDKLPQSLDTVYNQALQSINGYKATNETTAENILDLAVITNEDITKKLQNFSVTPATETSKGHLNGTLVLSDGVRTESISLSGCIIDYLDQSLATAKAKIEGVLNRYTLENTTTDENILDLVESVVDTNLYNSFAQVTIDKKATSDFAGSASVYIKVTDKKDASNFIEIRNTYKVATDPSYQTEEHLEKRVLNYLLLYKPTNETTSEDILNSIDADGIRVNTSIPISFGSSDSDGAFTKVLATDEANGSITGKVYIGDGSRVISLVGNDKLTILARPEYQTLGTLKSQILRYLPSLELQSSANGDDLVADLSHLITNSKLEISMAGYDKVPSTAHEKGYIEGGLFLSTTGAKEVINKVRVPLGLDSGNQSISEVKNEIYGILSGFKPTNHTTKQDLIDYISTVITNSNIKLSISDEDFKKVLATSKSDGSVSAKVVIQLGG